MDYRLVQQADPRTFVLIADPGDDAIQVLRSLAEAEKLSAAQVSAIGAFARATVGWFDRSAKEYRRIPIEQQCEVLSLIGDITDDEGPAVHVHAVLGLADGTVRGGHLIDAEVWPTLEIIVTESPAHLRKTHHPEIGLALIDLTRAGSPPPSSSPARSPSP